VDPPCIHFRDCGGCKWQHFDYQAQINHKEQVVRDAMYRLAKIDVEDFRPILGADKIFYYRNKMEYSFSNQRWKTAVEVEEQDIIPEANALGLHPPRFFNKVVDIDHCWLQEKPANDIRNFVRIYARQHELEFFDPQQHRGFLRNLILRNTIRGEWMVILSFYHEEVEARIALLDAILEAFPEITALHYVINGKKNDTLFDQDIICYYGQEYITETLGHRSFRIRPKSFFQTNPYQARHLYDIGREFCGLTGSETVYDLYTGTGSIAIYIADIAGQVVGIETIDDAIRDAEENARINEVSNTSFYVGDVRSVFSSELMQKHGRPDVLITDPPRGGMHEHVVQTILQGAPEKIVYISCNPSTQARVLAMLKEAYVVRRMQPVDMFPHTNHIENVALLTLR
jgi:23S rRNA (uracil1939-C5)-methyltransferase